MNLRCTGLAGLFVAIVAATSPAPADTIATDRPGNGNAPSTVPAWRLQVEASANYLREPGSAVITAPTAMRFGLPASIELRLASALIGVATFDDADSVIEPVDTLVGIKYSMGEQRGFFPQLGAVVDVAVPTGGNSFTADAVVPDARVAALWSLPAKLSVLANLGTVLADDSQGRYAQILYVASLGYSLTDRLFVFGESFGLVDSSGERDHVIQVDWGATYLLTDDHQLDVFGQHGVTDAAPTLQLAVGFSARL